MSRQIISYSLYGTTDKYLVGAIRNAAAVAHHYPDWQARFYVGASVPESIRAALAEAGATVIPIEGREDASAMFWRLLPFADPAVERVMIRDCDSRLSVREQHAVEAWLASGLDFHIMRDHPEHDWPILGGMWGATTHRLRELNARIDMDSLAGIWGEDQAFLYRHVYPLTKGHACIHDSFFARNREARPFPDARDDLSFVGEIIDENEQPRPEDRKKLARAMCSPLYRYCLRISSYLRSRIHP